MGIKVQLKSGAILDNHDVNQTKEFFEDRVLDCNNGFNALENDNACVIYRLSEIESIQIEK